VHRVSPALFSVDIQNLDLVLITEFKFQLFIKPNLEFFRSKAQVKLNTIYDHGPRLCYPLQVLFFCKARNFLNFLVNFLLKWIEIRSSCLTLSFANPLESVPKQLIPMFINIGNDFGHCFFLEVGVDVLCWFPFASIVLWSISTPRLIMMFFVSRRIVSVPFI
jgi:hypothetical protein